MSKIDNVDRKILNEMLNSKEWKYSSLAEALGLSPAAIHKRIRKLKKMGVLDGETPVLNLEKLGFYLTVLIFVIIRRGQIEEFAKKVKDHPSVCSIYNISGGFDVVIIAKFKHTSDLDRFVDGLTKEDFIERTNTSLVFSTVKEGANPRNVG